MPSSIQPRVIEAVVKVTEVCNINCTYCYVFNRGDESYKLHDKYMKPETVSQLADFLARAAHDVGATEIRVDFHGGEPLMLKKARFDEYCETFKARAPADVRVVFALQTNGMLVDEAWIALFRKHKVTVGVSIDGPQPINDVERIDHFGRGTYERTRKGLDALNDAYRDGLIPSFGLLTVASAKTSGAEIYRHFVHEVKVDALDFLLPIESHDEFDPSTSLAYGQFLVDAFDEWVKDDDPYIRIRIFSNTLAFFQQGKEIVKGARQSRDIDYNLITVSSNGDLGPDDSLRTLDLGLFSSATIRTDSLQSYRGRADLQGIRDAENTLPDGCGECAWKNLCRGGAANGRLINRFSSARGFNNKSIICEGLQHFYSHVAAHVLRNGVSFNQLTQSLIHEDEPFAEYNGAPCPFANHATAIELGGTLETVE